jgi:hypothetical protein
MPASPQGVLTVKGGKALLTAPLALVIILTKMKILKMMMEESR